VLTQIIGARLDGAHRVPTIRVSEAVDDLGDTLSLREASASRDSAGNTRLYIWLSPTPRRATRISRLTGEAIFWFGGTTQTVTIDNIRSRLGKPLENTLLSQAGLTVTAAEQPLIPATPNLKTLAVTFAGNQAGIDGVRILDADGKVLAREVSTSIQLGGGQMRVVRRMPLTDAMSLQLDVWSGAEALRVPIDLRDVVLP